MYSSAIDISTYPTAYNRNVTSIGWNQSKANGCLLDVYIEGSNTGPTADFSTSTPAGPYSGAGNKVSVNLSEVALLQDKRFIRYRLNYRSCNSGADTPSLMNISLEFD